MCQRSNRVLRTRWKCATSPPFIKGDVRRNVRSDIRTPFRELELPAGCRFTGGRGRELGRYEIVPRPALTFASRVPIPVINSVAHERDDHAHALAGAERRWLARGWKEFHPLGTQSAAAGAR